MKEIELFLTFVAPKPVDASQLKAAASTIMLEADTNRLDPDPDPDPDPDRDPEPDPEPEPEPEPEPTQPPLLLA